MFATSRRSSPSPSADKSPTGHQALGADVEGESKGNHDVGAEIALLEVIAYPMLSDRRTQGGGRQRTVLTPESLWRRRRLAGCLDRHDTSSTLFTGGLGRSRCQTQDRNHEYDSAGDNGSVLAQDPRGRAVPLVEGRARGDARRTSPDQGGDIGNSGSRCGDIGGEDAMKVLDDLVGMVTFGPLPEKEVTAAATGGGPGGEHPGEYFLLYIGL